MIDRIRIEPGHRPKLAQRDPRDTLGLPGKEETKAELGQLVAKLERLQRRLYAEARRSVLLVLQGLDASGKDGVVRAVFEGVNPQGCRVHSFKAPTSTELARDYLWRVHAACPDRGHIGIFNRSHYEDVVTVRMQNLAPEEVWSRRPGHIREFERMLADEGTDARQGLPARLEGRAGRSGSASGSPIRRSSGSSARPISRCTRGTTTTSPRTRT